MSVLCLAVLSGCAGAEFRLPFAQNPVAAVATEPPPEVVENPGADVTRPQPRPGATTPVADTARAPTGATGALGQTLAGLGSPTEGGVWLRTALVDQARPGRIRTDAGAVLDVELRPSGGAAGSGSHLSLAAMQALRLPLTQLHNLTVSAR